MAATVTVDSSADWQAWFRKSLSLLMYGHSGELIHSYVHVQIGLRAQPWLRIREKIRERPHERYVFAFPRVGDLPMRPVCFGARDRVPGQ
jgi:hypothetical protein